MSRSVVVVSVDGLTPASLQPYGCSWQPTPNFNKLCADSLVFDRCVADSVDAAAVFDSLLSGVHAARGDDRELVSWIQSLGDQSALITDASDLLKSPLANSFGQHVLSEYDTPGQPYLEIEETAMSELFATGIEFFKQQSPRLMWIHLSSLTRCWDVPRSLCHADDDITPAECTSPPLITQNTEFDPDELLGLMSVYGGQVRLLDLMLGIMIDTIDAGQNSNDTLLVLVGTSGMSLGEDGSFGFATGDANSAGVYLPLIVRGAGCDPVRSGRICQPNDLSPAIRDWLAGEHSGLLTFGSTAGWATESPRDDWALTVAPIGIVARLETTNWALRLDTSEPALFRKPDDRFDANDIASRAAAIVDEMTCHCRQAIAAIAAGHAKPPLSESLISGDW